MLGRTCCLALCTLLLMAAKVGSGQEPGEAAPSNDNPQSWVAQLNDDDYTVREQAAAKLTKAGTDSIQALIDGIASDQAEVAWRCGAALEQIGLEGDEKTIDLIVKHLDAAQAKSGRQGLKSLARDLYARQKQFRRDRAVAQIRKHGGQISGSGIDGGVDAMMMPAPFIGPAVIFDGPVMALEAAPVPEPVVLEMAPELPRAEAFDLFAEIGRAIGRAVGPGDPPLAIDEADVKPADAKAEAEVEKAVDEAKRATDAAVKELEKAAEEATQAAEGVKAGAEAVKEEPKAATDEAPQDEPAPAVDEALSLEAGGAVLADVGFAGVVVDVGGGMAVESSWAQLTIDQNWRGGDDGLAVLQDLPELAAVELRQSKLTDKALVHMAKLPSLRQLNLYQSGLSRDALLKFHRQRPGVLIYARGNAMMGVNADFGSSPLVLSSIFDGSGAAEAGLQVGDVICQIDGITIRDFSDLTICVSTKKPGDKIDVQYERGGKKRSVQIALKERTID